MMGYDVGARFRPDEEPTGLFDGTDAAIPLVQSLVDDVFASSARLPRMVPDATDNVSDFIGVLGDAAESAGKMHVAGGVSGSANSDVASNTAISIPANREQRAGWDPMSAIFTARFAGGVMAGGAGGRIGPSALDYGDRLLPDATVKVLEGAAGLEGLDQTHDFRQRGAELESIQRNAGRWDFPSESDFDGRMHGNPLATFEDLDAKSNADFGEGIEPRDARVLAALTGSVPTRPDEAAVENGATLEQNNEQLFGLGYGIERASSKGETEAVRDSIEKQKYPTDPADFSGPEGEFYPFIRKGLGGDGIQDFAVHDFLRRAGNGKQIFAVGTPNARTMMLAPSRAASDGDETPSVNRIPDFSGLWGMLRHAERILPKPSLTEAADDGQAAANEFETRPSHLLDMLNKLVATGLASHRQNDDARMSDEKLAAAGGRSGPTGHRNDPIYTVAVSSMTGTLMPLVPTPGSSTRSPPIPGQRNLP
jgi:hypothetical protein